MIVNKIHNSLIRKRILMERRAIFMLMLFILAYLISWAPYATLSLCSIVNIKFNLSLDPYFSALPGLIAKSSMLWTSTFYIISNKNLRNDIAFDPIRSRIKSINII
jgi:hypothetical protein